MVLDDCREKQDEYQRYEVRQGDKQMTQTRLRISNGRQYRGANLAHLPVDNDIESIGTRKKTF